MDKKIIDLANELKSVMTARDYDMSKMSNSYLQFEVKNAIAEINSCRRFTPKKNNLTGEMILYDSKYEYMIVPLCLDVIAKIGAEGQTSHSENGIVRNYDKKITSKIIPLIK